MVICSDTIIKNNGVVVSINQTLKIEIIQKPNGICVRPISNKEVR